MEKIVTALIKNISSFLLVLAGSLPHLIEKRMDNTKKERDREVSKKEKYTDEKKKVYIAILDRLLEIEQGLSYVGPGLSPSGKIAEKIKESNDEYKKVAAKLRLYAPDKIFNAYMSLVQYSKYAYVPYDKVRMSSEGIKAYRVSIKILGRLMQDDLGYREYDKDCDMIQCPKCRTEHDMVAKCPKCGLTFWELQKKVEETMMNEMQMAECECDTTDESEEDAEMNNVDKSRMEFDSLVSSINLYTNQLEEYDRSSFNCCIACIGFVGVLISAIAGLFALILYNKSWHPFLKDFMYNQEGIGGN